MNDNGMLKPVKAEGVFPVGLPGGFFIYENGNGDGILYADENVLQMYDCETLEEFKEYVGNSFKGMVYSKDYQTIQNKIEAQTAFGEKRHDYVRYRIQSKNGTIRYIEDFGHLLHGKGGKSFFYVFIVDVDRNEYFNRGKNSVAEAEILSGNTERDPLTGLYNMPYFYNMVHALLSSPEGRRNDICFVHFDVPNFKLFNERNGFRLGDELLCDLSRTIRDVFGNDIISRFSDDHFVVCASMDLMTCEKCVEDVYRRMLELEDVSKRVRIKAGIYHMDERMTEIGLACDHARLACNSIKGRHDVFFNVYDEVIRDKLRRQQYVIDHIDEAIENEYIKVFYQPVIRVESGEICGYEALVRWKDPNVGMLSPGDFIETLEQFHLIHRLDMFVIDRVCRDYREIMDKGYDIVPASINFSRLDFDLCDIFGYLEETRQKYEIPVNMLDLEITESAMNDNFGHIKDECNRMRQLGYQIWLDDFGSGYSSLNTLAEYSFDVLKLDMVFLKSYDTNPKTAALMTYIIEGARGMGLLPLCEGVESKEHFDFLKKAGCDKAQGYYFGKPMPMEDTRNFTMAKGLKWEKKKG